VIVGICFYVLPTIVASRRKSRQHRGNLRVNTLARLELPRLPVMRSKVEPMKEVAAMIRNQRDLTD
jgi:hypothetical protein